MGCSRDPVTGAPGRIQHRHSYDPLASRCQPPRGPARAAVRPARGTPGLPARRAPARACDRGYLHLRRGSLAICRGAAQNDQLRPRGHAARGRRTVRDRGHDPRGAGAASTPRPSPRSVRSRPRSSAPSFTAPSPPPTTARSPADSRGSTTPAPVSAGPAAGRPASSPPTPPTPTPSPRPSAPSSPTS